VRVGYLPVLSVFGVSRCGMAVSEEGLAVLAAKFAVMRQVADERTWRVYLGTEARALGRGGIAAVARASGVSETTVAAGLAEVEAGLLDALPRGRSRRAGAGRPRSEDTQPGLTAALLELAGEGTRGDPDRLFTWCSVSLRELARRLGQSGWRCGKDAVARMLRGQGYRLQAMSKVLEGKAQHPDRDGQFRHIHAELEAALAAGEPAVSVDAKCKETLGQYARAGRTWRPRGEPVRARDHSFADKDAVRIIPYGIYDIAADRGFISVGTSGNTAAFAVNGLRLWWRHEGRARYPDARMLLVTCDAGGGNGVHCWLWKHELAVLAAETGLDIRVCHFPPGTSKWNKIEHRCFCHITRSWCGRLLETIADAVAGINATTTQAGLACTAVTDEAAYPAGIAVSGQRRRYLQDCVLDRDDFHGEWNYTIRHRPRPAPAPEPEPEPAGRCPRQMLNQPALTGMDPGDIAALASALQVPFGAARAGACYKRRGGPRVNAARSTAPHGKLRLDLTDHVLALRLRDHLRLPVALVAAMLGVDPTTISHATSLARRLITGSAIPLPPAAAPPGILLRTPDDLRRYATTAGITLTVPEIPPDVPKHARHPRTPAQHAQTK
jgi:hypothetical protein